MTRRRNLFIAMLSLALLAALLKEWQGDRLSFSPSAQATIPTHHAPDAGWRKTTFTRTTLATCLDAPAHHRPFCVHALEPGEQHIPETCEPFEGRVRCSTDAGMATDTDKPVWIRITQATLTRAECLAENPQMFIACDQRDGAQSIWRVPASERH